MKKIPSVWKRDIENAGLLYDEVVPGCEWVLEGEGTATLKWDGTCCLVRRGVLYKRYDAKRGRIPPSGWEPCQDHPDSNTGHWPGWVKVDKTKPEDRWHLEAWHELLLVPADGTYELVGPKVQSNPYGLKVHELWRHGRPAPGVPKVPSFESVREWLMHHEHEGLVWWHPDGRMAKVKRGDFGLIWPC